MNQSKGIDVSKWQGTIDWKKVKASGIQFAIIRAAYGQKKDSYFNTNIKNALAAGISCGVYLYSYASTVAQARAEADYLLTLIKNYHITYPVFYDIEDSVQANLTNTERTDLICTFCDTILAGNFIPGVYASCSWYKTKFILDRMKKYEKWIAHWNASSPSYDGAYALWQYSSTGTIDGITGPVDLNYCYTDYSSYSQSFKAGSKITLSDTILYTSSTAKKVSSKISGTYYIYDGILLNKRFRITNQKKLVGAVPLAKNITGYVALADLI